MGITKRYPRITKTNNKQSKLLELNVQLLKVDVLEITWTQSLHRTSHI